MGRSENSRNRVFDPVPGARRHLHHGCPTRPSSRTPASSSITPVLTLGKTHIVTNGDQTDTIF